MKRIFDLSGLDGVLVEIKNGKELEDKIKEAIKNYHVSAAFRECFIYVPISGNSNDKFAFEYLDCIVALHLKRIYSTKTWKPIKDIYSIEGYKITHAYRKNIYDEYKIDTYLKKYSMNELSYIECIDTNGSRV